MKSGGRRNREISPSTVEYSLTDVGKRIAKLKHQLSSLPTACAFRNWKQGRSPAPSFPRLCFWVQITLSSSLRVWERWSRTLRCWAHWEYSQLLAHQLPCWWKCNNFFPKYMIMDKAWWCEKMLREGSKEVLSLWRDQLQERNIMS